MELNELTIIQIREKLKNKEIDAPTLVDSIIKKNKLKKHRIE